MGIGSKKKHTYKAYNEKKRTNNLSEKNTASSKSIARNKNDPGNHDLNLMNAENAEKPHQGGKASAENLLIEEKLLVMRT